MVDRATLVDIIPPHAGCSPLRVSWFDYSDTTVVGTGRLMSTLRRWLEGVTTEWHEAALCRTSRVEPRFWSMFDPIDEDAETEPEACKRAERAIESWCLSCPVLAQCGAEADQHWYQGVWGGEMRLRRGIVDVQTGIVIRRPHGDTPEPVSEPTPELPQPRKRTDRKRAARWWPREFATIKNRRGEDQYILMAVS